MPEFSQHLFTILAGAASIITIFSAITSALKISKKHNGIVAHRKRIIFAFSMALILSFYAGYVSFKYDQLKRSTDIRRQLNVLRDRFTYDFLPEFMNTMQDTSAGLPTQAEIEKLLPEAKNLQERLRHVDVEQFGDHDIGLQVYKYDLLSYVCTILTSLEHNTHEPDRAMTESAQALQFIMEDRRLLEHIREKKNTTARWQNFNDWADSQSLDSKLAYLNAWLIAIDLQSKDSNYYLIDFEKQIRTIKRDYLADHPMQDNIDMKELIRSEYANFSAQFRDDYLRDVDIQPR